MPEIFGIDLDTLEAHDSRQYPDRVPGRVLHVDSDFVAYQVSADGEKTFAEMCHNADVLFETLRLMAGADATQLHLTPSHSNKGYRHAAAIQKEYQGNRKDRQKPLLLNAVRTWMHQERGAIMHVMQEADDGLAQRMYHAERLGTGDKTVLCSLDKDLLMVPGLHMNWHTGEICPVSSIRGDRFGWIKLDRSKSSPKVLGRGTKFFWAQMMMGDTADNIQGLPKVWLGSKWGPAGPVATHSLLKDIPDDKIAFHGLRAQYQMYGDKFGFKHWETGEDVDWSAVFVSEAKLLWMRRKEVENDVVDWFSEKCL